MDFELTDVQQQLADSAAKFLRNQHPFRPSVDQSASERLTLWQQFAALGWLGLPFPEEDGGLGCGHIESMLLMQAFGRALVTAPYISTIIHAGEILRRSQRTPIHNDRISAVINGQTIVVVAHSEFAGRYQPAYVDCRAIQTGDGWILRGQKHIVQHGDIADFYIVSARTCGEVGDSFGVSLFWVPADSAGLSRTGFPLLDGRSGSSVILDHVFVPCDALLGEYHQGQQLLAAASDAALAAIGAEALGVMDALLQQTLSYCQQRRQFGQPIGKFQVLQHRLVDMLMATEQVRSLVYLANIRLLEKAPPHVTAMSLSAMKVAVGKAGRFIGQEAVQLHGGMGMSHDVIVGHYFRRLTAIDAMFGNVDFHLQQFAAHKNVDALSETVRAASARP